jgi:putative ABC transport system permease protein
MHDAAPDWKALIRARAGGATLDDDAVDEIAEHAEELYREQRLAGRAAEEARDAVVAEMTDLPVLMRAAKAARRRRLAPAAEVASPGRLRVVSAFGRDLAHGARLLAARPSFTAVALLTLALGIGANTAIFSVVNAVLVEPLPFSEPEKLVMIWEQDASNPQDLYIVSAPNWQDWVKASTSFSHLAIWEMLRFNIAGDGEPEQAFGMRVSASLFAMLGVAPQIGRTFTDGENAPGHDVVVIGDALWRGRYGANPDVIGRTTRINGRPFEIIGVMPRSFVFLNRNQQVWVPIAFNENDAQRDSHSFYAAARIKENVSFDAAKVEIETLGGRLAAEHKANEGESASITPLTDLGISGLRPTLYTLLGAVGLVLLIACVNVANLLLAQASGRQREFAIRSALGAGRARLASQLLAEGLLLATAGGALGLALAWAGTAALAQSLPPSIVLAPFRNAASIPIDAGVLAFTFGIAAVTGVLFSLAPMLGMARYQPGASLKSTGDRGGTARFTGLRGVLVAVEVALAVVVLAGAGLMIRSVSRLVAVDPGLDAANVLVMEMALPQADFYGPPIRTSFCEDVERGVAAVPGVQALGAISHLPLSGANASRGFSIEGVTLPPDEGASAAYRLTCPGYFEAMGITMLRGRDFTHADATTAPGVVIINETAAARYFKDRDPLGRRIKLGGPDSRAPWLTIVGISKDVRHFGLDSEARREMFRPYSQAAWPAMTVTVKAGVDPVSIAAPVRNALRQVDSEQPVTRIRTMDDVIAESIGQRRFPMLLLGIFAIVALVLAAIGVYGVVSYVVSQRTREIGIRMALGARAGEVVGMVVRRSLWPIGAGIAAGVSASLAASRLLGALLYGVTPYDPVVLGAIVAILGGSAVAACLVPARRAASVDPLVVLKEE